MAHQITASIADHKITATAAGTLTAGTVDHWTLKATFDGEWAGLTKRVTFVRGGVHVGPLDYADGMYVPWEVLAEPGMLRLGFVGVTSDGIEQVRTAYHRDGIRVVPSGSELDRSQVDATIDIIVQARAELDQLAEDVEDFEDAETAQMVRDAVAKGRITQEECDDILAE